MHTDFILFGVAGVEAVLAAVSVGLAFKYRRRWAAALDTLNEEQIEGEHLRTRLTDAQHNAKFWRDRSSEHADALRKLRQDHADAEAARQAQRKAAGERGREAQRLARIAKESTEPKRGRAKLAAVG